MPGTLLAGRYVVGELLGRGGAAAVYSAEDRVIGVRRALKVMEGADGVDDATRGALRARLHDEAQVMARLAHPNVVAVHDVGAGEGYDWVVMDLVEGGTLAEAADRGGVTVGTAVRWMGQVLSALEAAHAASIIHRDVKPQNILIDRYGNARLADFGIALIRSDTTLRTTRTGVAMGSLAYMAPEQRLDARGVTVEADIYGVGATLFQIVSGASPMDLFMAGEHSDRLAGVPVELRRVIVAATRYEPSRRYSSAAGMAAALAEAGRRGEGAASGEAAARAEAAVRATDDTAIDEMASDEAAPGDAPALPGSGNGAREREVARPGSDVHESEPVVPVWLIAAPVLAGLAVVGVLITLRAPSDAPDVRPAGASPMDRMIAMAQARPLGTWHGSMTPAGGSPSAGSTAVRFDLAGSLEHVTGVVRVAGVEHRVLGRYAVAGRTLTLVEEQPSEQSSGGGTWTLVFDDALSKFTGRFDPGDGSAGADLSGGADLIGGAGE